MGTVTEKAGADQIILGAEGSTAQARRATCQTFRTKVEGLFLRGLPDELYRGRFLIFEAGWTPITDVENGGSAGSPVWIARRPYHLL